MFRDSSLLVTDSLSSDMVVGKLRLLDPTPASGGLTSPPRFHPLPQLGNAIVPADNSLRSTIELLQYIWSSLKHKNPPSAKLVHQHSRQLRPFSATSALQKSGISLDSTSSSQILTEASFILFIDRVHRFDL